MLYGFETIMEKVREHHTLCMGVFGCSARSADFRAKTDAVDESARELKCMMDEYRIDLQTIVEDDAVEESSEASVFVAGSVAESCAAATELAGTRSDPIDVRSPPHSPIIVRLKRHNAIKPADDGVVAAHFLSRANSICCADDKENFSPFSFSFDKKEFDRSHSADFFNSTI